MYSKFDINQPTQYKDLQPTQYKDLTNRHNTKT